jgi:excinuclease ABC subunit C
LSKKKSVSCFDLLKFDIRKIPKSAGVYQFMEESGKILYIGKAVDLRSRVSQYTELRDTRPSVIHLMQKAAFVEIILAGSEQEALILESHLIKKHQPFFNINLKDDKSYPYLAVAAEKFPRLVVTRHPHRKYLFIKGPFTQVSLLKSLKELIQSIYPLKYCSKRTPKGCINGQMGICSTPCNGKTENYNETVSSVIELLKGKKWHLLSGIVKNKIEKAVKDLNFEKAAILRDILTILPDIKKSYGIEFSGKGGYDVFVFKKEGEYLFVTVGRYRNGKLFYLKTFCEKTIFESMESSVISGIASFYDGIFVSEKISIEPDIIDLDQLTKATGQTFEKKISVRKNIREILEKNMEQSISTFFQKEEKTQIFTKEISVFSNIDVKSIACIDVSTFGGKESVASLVWWENGKFIKSKYRKYKIKSVEGINDFASLKEVAERIKKRWGQNTMEKPSLLMIDGGKGQISSVKKVLGNEILIAGIVKDRGKKKGHEKLIREDGQTIELTDSITANILKSIRDEAHRFAITFNRSLRKKKFKEQ